MRKQVNIAEFKSHLSEHLHQVRRGASIIILDRKTPIATVVPLESKREEKLQLLSPKIKKGIKKLRFKPVKLDFDPLEVFIKERHERDDRLHRFIRGSR